LLLFNLEYLGYVVIEKINNYMNYFDKNLKKDNFNKTIEIIITKEEDKFILSYC